MMSFDAVELLEHLVGLRVSKSVIGLSDYR